MVEIELEEVEENQDNIDIINKKLIKNKQKKLKQYFILKKIRNDYIY